MNRPHRRFWHTVVAVSTALLVVVAVVAMAIRGRHDDGPRTIDLSRLPRHLPYAFRLPRTTYRYTFRQGYNYLFTRDESGTVRSYSFNDVGLVADRWRGKRFEDLWQHNPPPASDRSRRRVSPSPTTWTETAARMSCWRSPHPTAASDWWRGWTGTAAPSCPA